MIKDVNFLDTLDRRGNRHRYYSSFGFNRHYDHHRYCPYKRSNRVYLSYEFNKSKPPIFDGEMNKSQDAETWSLGMREFFRLHDYSKNIKAKIAKFSLKGKVDICWEYVNNIRYIYEEDLNLSGFDRLSKKKYLSQRYFDDREKQFYELNMGSMTDEEYTRKFLELLRYVPYHKEEKAKI